jgi:hypothetical protein
VAREVVAISISSVIINLSINQSINRCAAVDEQIENASSITEEMRLGTNGALVFHR